MPVEVILAAAHAGWEVMVVEMYLIVPILVMFVIQQYPLQEALVVFG